MSDHAPHSAAGAWHIFRKDLRLVWPVAVAAAVLQGLLGVLSFRPQPYSGNHFEALATVLTLGLAVSFTLLILLTVQQDAVPSVAQDWLVRPIRRRDLLLAKLTAVGLLVHGPIVMVQVIKGVAEGLPLGQMLPAVLLSSLDIALVFSLPVMAIAALSKSVTDALLVALALFLTLMLVRFLVLALLFPVSQIFHFAEPTDATGIAWIWQFCAHALLLLATLGTLLLQYFHRRTPVSRLLLFAGLLLFMWVPSLSWQPAFAVQQLFARPPHAGRAVALALDAGAGTDARFPDAQLLVADSDDGDEKPPVDRTTLSSLPLSVSGLPERMILHADHTVIRLRRPDGTLLYTGTGHVFDARAAGDEGTATVQQVVEIPATVRAQLRGQTVRLELDYSLTLMQPRAQVLMNALDGELRSATLGHCISRKDPGGNAIEVACLKAGESPPCRSLMLQQESRPLGAEKFDCTLNYEPEFMRFSEEPIDHSKNRLPVAGPAASLTGAHVLLRSYEPEDHMSRHLVVPDFHLQD